jgi:lysophospholipase L1-like esterase
MKYSRLGKWTAFACVILIVLAILKTNGMMTRMRTKLERRWADMQKADLRDYGEVARYREENSRLGPPLKGETRIVFFGDSITELWERESGFFAAKGYLNRGVSGQTTSQMLLRFRQDVIGLQPVSVVILGGTNDIAQDDDADRTLYVTTGNLASMCELASAHGIRVALASLPPVNDDARDAGGSQIKRTSERPPAVIKALNDWMKQYAAQHNYAYLDYFGAMADADGMLKRELSDDGLHPNKKGYAVMAPLAEEAIEKTLNSR